MTLKCRSGFSFRAAAGKIENVLDRLQAIGMEYAPITDRASTFAFYRWKKAAEARGMKPCFGVELAVTTSINAKKPSVDWFTFIAQDSVEPINELVTLATTQFRYQPLLTLEQALEARHKCSVMTGHRPQLDWERPIEGVHVMLGPSTSRAIAKRALENGWAFAASSDNRFPTATDKGFYEVLTGRNAETQTYAQWILSPDEWWKSVEHLGLPDEVCGLALHRSLEILQEHTATLQKSSLPKFKAEKTLRQLCEEGAVRLGVDLGDPVYAARLEREIKLIEDKGYQDYFYIVADMCNWARSRMMLGPARGSSCGSLVCYLIGITTVDPIPHGLLFERFVDVHRNDMPDVDVDISDQHRSQVFKYLESKYGKEHVARLGTVAMFQPRSALAEVGTALSIPKWKCDAVAESMIERSSGDSRALFTLEDTLNTMPAGKRLLEEHPEASVVSQFEGHPRHAGQHAAGVVISDDPIIKIVAVDDRTGATHCDKKDAEDYNLLKIDCLGLTQLSVFEDALELAGLPLHHLESLPLDDPEAFKVLNDAKWSGIFQFNGQALQSITKQFIVSSFDDIVSVTALGRPGPLASGGAHEWIRRRNGVNPVTYPHPIFEPYLKTTYGIVLYQEDIMMIGREVGGLTWEDVTLLRKAMSKSLGKEYFDQFGDRWKQGAMERGVPAGEGLDKLWNDLCAFGAWCFNKSHSVAYGLISYWCCWLKAHHPFEFAAATLSHENDPMRQIQLLREMRSEGYEYVPIDPELSGRKWTVGERAGKRYLVGPLHNVKGIGPKMVNNIIGARNRGEPIPDRCKKLLTNPKTDIDSLWPVRDGFKRLMPDPLAMNIVTHPTKIIDVQPQPVEQTVVVFATLSKINPRDENEVVIVARRGYEIKDGKTTSLNLTARDDTDSIFCKISRYDYERLGKPIVDRGRIGKSLYAIKGTVRANASFRMIQVKSIKYIGDLDKSVILEGEA